MRKAEFFQSTITPITPAINADAISWIINIFELGTNGIAIVKREWAKKPKSLSVVMLKHYTGNGKYFFCAYASNEDLSPPV
ncbi:MAG: hypothetical protein U9N41_05380 [Euryarchaeota archaeon]|nr:hypothetical protein [Euryarchaeota archaeon]